MGDGDLNKVTNDSAVHPPLPVSSPLSLPHLAAMVNVAVTWRKLGMHQVQTREMFERALKGYEHTPSIG
jgi:hypothetical protein